MKKLLLVFVIMFFLCGCNAKEKDIYAGYDHYSLKYKRPIMHTFYNDNSYKQEYALADITPEVSETLVYGLFYKVADDDYILIDKIEPAQSIEYISKFMDNKLYLVTGDVIEYTLDHEKIEKKELDLDYYKGFLARSLKNIDEENIYLGALTNDDETGYSIDVNLKCSLSTYKCEEYDET